MPLSARTKTAGIIVLDQSSATDGKPRREQESFEKLGLSMRSFIDGHSRGSLCASRAQYPEYRRPARQGIKVTTSCGGHKLVLDKVTRFASVEARFA